MLEQFSTVSIGRIGALECDFIFRHGDANYAYAQVAMTIMADKNTEDRDAPSQPESQIRGHFAIERRTVGDGPWGTVPENHENIHSTVFLNLDLLNRH